MPRFLVWVPSRRFSPRSGEHTQGTRTSLPANSPKLSPAYVTEPGDFGAHIWPTSAVELAHLPCRSEQGRRRR